MAEDTHALRDLPKGGERIVHLRVRVGKSRATVAAELGWHPEAYREWETGGGHTPEKMAGPATAGRTTPDGLAGAGGYTPFFTRPMVEKGTSIDGTSRQPV